MSENKNEDAYLYLVERFNQHKLNHLIKHTDVFRSQMTKCVDEDYNPFAIAIKYLAKSRNGLIKTKYKQNQSFGRFRASGALSLQCLQREIRHTIASEHYTDIDIVNAHPVILSFLCGERGIPCKYLNKYINNRDTFLADLGILRDQAKTLVLSIVNGGKSDADALEDPPEWLGDLKKEMKNIHLQFAKDPAFKLHKKKRVENNNDYNNEASYMNTLLCDFENKILQSIYKGLGSPKDCVLCFDGLMIPKETQFDLSKLEAVVEKTLGIEISLAIKEMTDGFELGELGIPNVEPYVDIDISSELISEDDAYVEFKKMGEECETINGGFMRIEGAYLRLYE